MSTFWSSSRNHGSGGVAGTLPGPLRACWIGSMGPRLLVAVRSGSQACLLGGSVLPGALDPTREWLSVES